MSSASRQTSAPELGAVTTPDQSVRSASSAATHTISGPTLKILQALQRQALQQAPERWAPRHVPPTWCTLPPAPRWWQTRCTAPLAAPPRATASRASAPGRPPAGGGSVGEMRCEAGWSPAPPPRAPATSLAGPHPRSRLTSALTDRLTQAARASVCQSQPARQFRRSSIGSSSKDGRRTSSSADAVRSMGDSMGRRRWRALRQSALRARQPRWGPAACALRVISAAESDARRGWGSLRRSKPCWRAAAPADRPMRGNEALFVAEPADPSCRRRHQPSTAEATVDCSQPEGMHGSMHRLQHRAAAHAPSFIAL